VGTVYLAESSHSIDSGQLTSGKEGALDWGETLGWRTVSCTTIDQECLHWGFPDAVKIDTEGCEIDILAGAPLLIARRSATWYIEMHARSFEEQVRDIFSEGYAVHTIDGISPERQFDNYYMLARPE
jgi:hypothetical protein